MWIVDTNTAHVKDPMPQTHGNDKPFPHQTQKNGRIFWSGLIMYVRKDPPVAKTNLGRKYQPQRPPPVWTTT